MCSSSGGQNCVIQLLVSSHCVDGRPVRTCAPDGQYKCFKFFVRLFGEIVTPECLSGATVHNSRSLYGFSVRDRIAQIFWTDLQPAPQ